MKISEFLSRLKAACNVFLGFNSSQKVRPAGRTFIYAGTYQQFEWIKKHLPFPVDYIRDFRSLEGQSRGSVVLLYGTWYERRERDDRLFDEIKARGMETFKLDDRFQR